MPKTLIKGLNTYWKISVPVVLHFSVDTLFLGFFKTNLRLKNLSARYCLQDLILPGRTKILNCSVFVSCLHMKNATVAP